MPNFQFNPLSILFFQSSQEIYFLLISIRLSAMNFYHKVLF
ncbi:hypothetical protein LEP1GSC008_1992 [Leptospira kirschneri serovar Bulgarica str. Nikolaevo]|uniref:Uncharacterized protein n=1 Tax=Leptospira kirschneri serovar Bulgarica str. Nikolaevo TaxID=1240687 RepID=M6EZC5_9LEPT|nr:hypothetical protein LEP1GSC008_1992 [Leptospira kirschneri serovar Bulgarica str. Nikolaevo]